MENDIKEEKEQNLIDLKDYFKMDFPKQKLDGNRQYEEYKKLKLNELGKDAKLLHCKKDNIYFYISKEECKNNKYNIKCPSCNEYICYFCGKNNTYQITEFIDIDCCFKLKFYYFFSNGFANIDKSFNCKYYNILFLLPFTGIILFNFLIINLSMIVVKRDLFDGPGNIYTSFIIYMSIVHGFMLSICYFFYDIYFKLIALIISLFTKFYPYKYIFGILMGIFEDKY